MSADVFEKNIHGVQYRWDMERGQVEFEGEPVVLFWIDTAFKTFLDTIEEVTGDGSAQVVLEAAGYRTGVTVSEFYKQRLETIDELFITLPKIYKAAGWGLIDIMEVDKEAKTARVKITDDWEMRINNQNEKKKPGTFLAGHWAGVLSGLFKENIWYKTIKHPLYGDDHIEINFFPSDITPSVNIKSLLSEIERREITRLEALVEDRTRDLQNLIKDISSPIIPVLENIVVIPMMGQFDETRANELMEKTLSGVVSSRSNIIIFDVTGMNHMEDYTVTMLGNITQAVSLIGSTPVLAGISPEMSMQLVSNGVYLRDLKCFATLKHAIHYALALEGLQISPKE